jgi:hypothetical protein
MRAWLNVGEAADTIYTACERSELRHVRIGGRRCIRVRPEWLDEWYERNTRHSAGTAGSSAPSVVVSASR